VFVPRIYQTAADEAIAAALAPPKPKGRRKAEDGPERVRSVLAVLATGLGKTYLAAMVAARRRPLGKTLFLAHVRELIWQAEPAFEEMFGAKPGIEMGQEHRVNADLFASRSPVVLGTVQTQFSGGRGRGRMTHFDPREFSTLIVDEAHHYVSPKYRAVINYYLNGNPDLVLVGFTATPDRGDGLAMGRVFQRSAYNYGICEGINDGWLVPVDQWAGTVSGIDLTDVPEEAGDLDPEKLARVMERDANVFGVIDHTIERVGEKKTLMFASSKEHAELMASIINKKRPSAGARVVHYKTPVEERREIFADFAARRFQYLCNMGICTEGFNDPGIEAVGIGRPTTSRALYTQMIGRGTRPLCAEVVNYEHPDDRKLSIGESEKPSVLVLDFVGNSGQHKLISAADVLGGDYDREVRERAKKNTTDAAAPKPVQAALSEAALQIMAERRRREEDERTRLASLEFTSSARFEQVDPFSHASGAGDGRHEGPADGGSRRPLTEGMIAFLDRYAPKKTKIEDLSFPAAQRLIVEIKRRWKAGICSLDQSRVFSEKGLPGDVPKDTARDWMERLKANDWHVPADLRREVREMKRRQDRDTQPSEAS
jgi:superfamily II DNA or RNA helicase